MYNFALPENTSSRELPEQKVWMAKVYKKRGPHSEENRVPGRLSAFIIRFLVYDHVMARS